MTIKEFIEKHNLTMIVQRIKARVSSFDYAPRQRHWHCDIGRDTESDVWVGVEFSQGSADNSTPKLVDVMECLAMDASGVENTTYRQWCDDLGMAPDSIKNLNTYNAIVKNNDTLKQLLGDVWYEFLQCESEEWRSR